MVFPSNSVDAVSVQSWFCRSVTVACESIYSQSESRLHMSFSIFAHYPAMSHLFLLENQAIYFGSVSFNFKEVNANGLL